MLSRRKILQGTAATVVAGATRAPVPASQPSTRVTFTVPPNACDTHTHIFGDPQRFPLSPTRGYTPEPASVAEMRALHRALHIDRVVIVQPSIYGTDNSCTLDAMKQLGNRARGIAVIDEHTSGAALDEMDRAGVRGVRINLGTSGQSDPAVARRRFLSTAEWIAGRNWHIQIYTQLSVIAAIRDLVEASPMPVVFDHFGGAQAQLGPSQSGFDALLDLVRSGKGYVKITAPYRSSKQAANFSNDYGDVAPLAKALITTNSRRVLWGTDWPHPDSTSRRPLEVQPLYQIDDGRVMNQLAVWAPDPQIRKTILVDNPAALYGY
jgi:predicted TIM-barrel fold metal-dependent hydrolase